jgi:hypothetical protein
MLFTGGVELQPQRAPSEQGGGQQESTVPITVRRVNDGVRRQSDRRYIDG